MATVPLIVSKNHRFSTGLSVKPLIQVEDVEYLWLRSLGGGVFAALRGGLVAAIAQDWLQVGVAV
ncbi:hypothetical protein [Rhodococcus pyridinivorans]|uniref:hypothetical protein n=1 Tax=Rhodococcus pyridinivorans TaxID=103816 RepID=UPI00110F072D|nr:hypothetical protein [Rhodococcus pyridinivorans]